MELHYTSLFTSSSSYPCYTILLLLVDLQYSNAKSGILSPGSNKAVVPNPPALESHSRASIQGLPPPPPPSTPPPPPPFLHPSLPVPSLQVTPQQSSQVPGNSESSIPVLAPFSAPSQIPHHLVQVPISGPALNPTIPPPAISMKTSKSDVTISNSSEEMNVYPPSTTSITAPSIPVPIPVDNKDNGTRLGFLDAIKGMGKSNLR